jgi:predicted aconitase with swiveling domain
LLEAVRLGTAPAAMITAVADGILVLGAVVARELYQQAPPILVVADEDYGRLQTGQQIIIAPDGTITISP